MTREGKKDRERYYAQLLLDGLISYVRLEDLDPPDFWVRRGPEQDIALEVTEYHPADDDADGVQRCAVEQRWRASLWPLIDQARRTRPALRSVRVTVGFKDRSLPGRRDHHRLAAEMVELVNSVVPRLGAAGNQIAIHFAPRETVARIPAPHGGWQFLPEEDWPISSRWLSFVKLMPWAGFDWFPWSCPQVEAAFVGPSSAEFNRILESKAAKAQNYPLNGAPLWLLILCDLGSDLKSHIFPTDAVELSEVFRMAFGSQFQFGESPFAQVWLLSAFSGNKIRLHPRQPLPPQL
jgi:hypothetical protein